MNEDRLYDVRWMVGEKVCGYSVASSGIVHFMAVLVHESRHDYQYRIHGESAWTTVTESEK